MKKLLILPVLAMALFACNMASEEDYNNMAKDTCDCIEGSMEGMSDRAKGIIGDSDGDPTKIQQGFASYMLEDPTAAGEDYKVMAAMESSTSECMEKMEKKYDNIYSADSEEERMEKLMDAVNKLDDGCKVSKVILKMGYEAQK